MKEELLNLTRGVQTIKIVRRRNGATAKSRTNCYHLQKKKLGGKILSVKINATISDEILSHDDNTAFELAWGYFHDMYYNKPKSVAHFGK